MSLLLALAGAVVPPGPDPDPDPPPALSIGSGGGGGPVGRSARTARTAWAEDDEQEQPTGAYALGALMRMALTIIVSGVLEEND